MEGWDFKVKQGESVKNNRVGTKSEEIKFEVTFSDVFQGVHKMKMEFYSKAFIPSHCWGLGRKGECRIQSQLRL